MKNPKILILNADGTFDEKEYDTLDEAIEAFRKINRLLVNDKYERCTRLIDEEGVVRGTFDSLTDSWSIQI